VEEAVNVLLPPPGWKVNARPAVWAAEPVTTIKGEDDGLRLAQTAPTIRVLPKGVGIEVRVEGVPGRTGVAASR